MRLHLTIVAATALLLGPAIPVLAAELSLGGLSVSVGGDGKGGAKASASLGSAGGVASTVAAGGGNNGATVSAGGTKAAATVGRTTNATKGTNSSNGGKTTGSKTLASESTGGKTKDSKGSGAASLVSRTSSLKKLGDDKIDTDLRAPINLKLCRRLGLTGCGTHASSGGSQGLAKLTVGSDLLAPANLKLCRRLGLAGCGQGSPAGIGSGKGVAKCSIQKSRKTVDTASASPCPVLAAAAVTTKDKIRVARTPPAPKVRVEGTPAGTPLEPVDLAPARVDLEAIGSIGGFDQQRSFDEQQSYVDYLVERAIEILDYKGDDRQPAIAARMLSDAAEAGNREAMTRLAELYAAGDGVPVNPTRAEELLQQAAATGDGQ